MNYELKYPPVIIFGCGSINRIPELLKNKKSILMITGSGAAKNSAVANFAKELGKEKILEFICGGLGSEAPLETVDNLIQRGRKINADAVVAIGGGSVIDLAKAAAGIIPLDGTIRDYFYDGKKIPRKGLFFIATPSTAGTGSEITENAVLSDNKTLVKKSIRSQYLIPDIALVDPELTYSCPAKIAADSGMDAFVQAVESLVSPEANTVSKIFAAKAISLLMQNLPDAVSGSKTARNAVAEGSLLSAMSFSQTGLGAVHGLAHPIGIKYKIPHGRICGILMRKVFRANTEKIPFLYDEAALACGLKSTNEFLEKAESIADSIGIPETFFPSAPSEEEIDFIVKNSRSRSMERNPCQFSDDELKNIILSFVKT